ncbi:MAG: VWA domain-containing protein, partial [Spirochaetota bacterium]|nr:VWA domain-containing protein [Spirochaetota bacterium]
MFLEKIKNRHLFLFLALIIMVLAPAGADNVADFSIEWMDTSAFPVNVIYYLTSDQNGEPAGAMWVPDMVRIYEEGIRHSPGKFEDDEHAPAYISLIIDSSGSMEGSLEEVLKAARLLIMQFDRQDQAELIDFDSRVVTRTSFTDDTGAMLQSLDEVEVGGGTALFDAVAAGLDHLRPHQGMKAVLVLSDGEDENSMEHSLESLRPRLQNEGVRVFTIALGASVDAGTMTEIAELSGGAFYQADRSEDVGGIYTGIITYLHSLHRMWYSTALGAFDGSRHTLRVEHEPTGTVQSAEYRAPEDEYWSHAIDVRPESHAAPIRITPDGDYTALLQHRAVIDSDGSRHTLHDW